MFSERPSEKMGKKYKILNSLCQTWGVASLSCCCLFFSTSHSTVEYSQLWNSWAVSSTFFYQNNWLYLCIIYNLIHILAFSQILVIRWDLKNWKITPIIIRSKTEWYRHQENKKLALASQLQTYQILTNNDHAHFVFVI